MQRRRFCVGGVAALAAAAYAPRLTAQPATVLRIIFPFGAGGSGDSLCRVLAEQLAPILGRSVIVENRTGADGRIGINAARSAPADGATFLITTGPTMWLLPLVHKAPGYDPYADFEPVAQLALFEFCVSVANYTGIKTVTELVAWVKANPDKSTYAIPAAGTIPHFIGVSLSKAFGVDMKKLPYRGGAPAITDLVGGQIPLSVGTVADALQQHRAGTIRTIASTGDKRSEFLPEVPTLQESGYGIVADAWYGMWAPKGTPTPLVAEMNRAVLSVLAKPEIKARLQALGLVATGTTGAKLSEIMQEQAARWKPVLEDSGYRMDN
jgi:tripartite-type tricarboxylate transporter receptor subunit TctC